MLHVQVSSIAPSLTNPRKHFDPAKLQELADSIKASGVHQPVLLRPLPPERLEDTFRIARAQGRPAPEYELVAGERRWRACRMAGLTEAPVVVKDVTDEQAMELALVENLQREDLDPVEEAVGIHELMTRCDLTQEQATNPDYLQQALIPLPSETHSGEDVAVFATGPWSHLFRGVIEQNVIYHVMAKAVTAE